jgi:hypothetical protein
MDKLWLSSQTNIHNFKVNIWTKRSQWKEKRWFKIVTKLTDKKTLPSYTLIQGFTPFTYDWTVTLILDHSYLVGNLTNSKIAETKALEPLKSSHFCISNFRTC